jgi:hypothetical protein
VENMANIFEYKKDNLDDITLDYMKEMAIIVMNSGIKHFAIVGCSGDTYFLYGESRKAQVSFRNYFGTLELLITDLNGRFITYNKLDGLSFDDLINEYYRQFLTVKHLINTDIDYTFGDDWFNDDIAEGFLKKWTEVGGEIRGLLL